MLCGQELEPKVVSNNGPLTTPFVYERSGLKSKRQVKVHGQQAFPMCICELQAPSP